MLYWVYEELEYSPERNVEIFIYDLCFGREI